MVGVHVQFFAKPCKRPWFRISSVDQFVDPNSDLSVRVPLGLFRLTPFACPKALVPRFIRAVKEPYIFPLWIPRTAGGFTKNCGRDDSVVKDTVKSLITVDNGLPPFFVHLITLSPIIYEHGLAGKSLLKEEARI